MRLYVDGEIVGENPMNCSLDMDLFVEGLKRLCLACPDENKDVLHGFVYRLDILTREAAIKKHYVKVCSFHLWLLFFLDLNDSFVSEDCCPLMIQDPPFRLSIDHSSTSEIEEDSDGVWSIVGGKVKSIITLCYCASICKSLMQIYFCLVSPSKSQCCRTG